MMPLITKTRKFLAHFYLVLMVVVCALSSNSLLLHCSLGNGIPSRLKFCMPAPNDARQFNNWLDALRAVAQLAPYGIDPIWRPEVWLGCAEHNFRGMLCCSHRHNYI